MSGARYRRHAPFGGNSLSYVPSVAFRCNGCFFPAECNRHVDGFTVPLALMLITPVHLHLRGGGAHSGVNVAGHVPLDRGRGCVLSRLLLYRMMHNRYCHPRLRCLELPALVFCVSSYSRYILPPLTSLPHIMETLWRGGGRPVYECIRCKIHLYPCVHLCSPPPPRTRVLARRSLSSFQLRSTILSA